MANVGNIHPVRLLALPLLSTVFALILAANSVSAHDRDATNVKSVSGANIEITRGTPSDFALPPTQVVKAQPSRYAIVPNTTGWLVDRKEGRIGNCYRMNTAKYRKRVVRCVWKPLPQ